MKLTREKALKYHNQMWSDMQEELGDNPTLRERFDYKDKWCEEHFPNERIINSCFLCEYTHCDCSKCPIKWPGEGERTWMSARCESSLNDDNTWTDMPISKMLNLPIREESKWYEKIIEKLFKK